MAFSPRNYLTLEEVFTVFFCLQTKTLQISRPPHMLVLMPDCPSAPLPLTCSCSGFKTQLVAQPREGTHYTCTAGNFETSQRLHLTCEGAGFGKGSDPHKVTVPGPDPSILAPSSAVPSRSSRLPPHSSLLSQTWTSRVPPVSNSQSQAPSKLWKIPLPTSDKSR